MSARNPTTPPAPMTARRDWPAVAAVCAVVLAVYAWIIPPAGVPTELGARQAQEEYYNLLVRGFEAGRLDLPIDVPEGLKALADPYDPALNAPYGGWMYRPHRLHDMSYFQGKFYLYFSPTPAVLLFWPWHAVTGGFVAHRWAIWLFCSLGFLTGTAILWRVRRRHFPELALPLLLGGIIALGLAAGTPALFRRPDVWEVPISCGHLFGLVALACVLEALASAAHRWRWTLAAGVATSLAISARPSLLFGGAILLLPLWQTWRESEPAGRRRKVLRLLLCVAGPLALVGAAVALFNWSRFGSLLEFGQKYQLAGDRQDTARHFDWRYLWINFRLYFLEPVRWIREFPYATTIQWPALPPGHGGGDRVYGLLTNTPATLFALALPWAWLRPGGAGWRQTLLAVTTAFAGIAFVLGWFYGTCQRYEFEFQAYLMLLAVLGCWTLATRWSGIGRFFLTAVAAGLLAFSVLFSLCIDAGHYSGSLAAIGVKLADRGLPAEGVELVEAALRLRPGLPDADLWLGNVLSRQLGRPEEAFIHYEAALRLKPDAPEIHNNLALLLSRSPGREAEAVVHYETALRLRPDAAAIHFNYGRLLETLAGRRTDALREYATALRLQPDFAPARNALARLGVGVP